MRNVITLTLEIATVIGAIIGGFLVLTALAPGNSAIQSAASAAVGIGFVAIPYALASTFHRAMMRAVLLKSSSTPAPERGVVVDYLKAKISGEA